MMKNKVSIVILGFAVLFLIVGCATTQELTSSVKSKVASITSNVDPALVSQVPADKREGFAKAEYELQVASEKLKLAALKTEMAGAQKTYAEYEEEMATGIRKEASFACDIVKIEAIIKSGLGKSKEDNVKLKADLQSRKLKGQADRINTQAGLDNTKAKIEDLSAQIAKMENVIKAMKFDGEKTPQPEKK